MNLATAGNGLCGAEPNRGARVLFPRRDTV